jgi:histone H3/H4
MMTAQTAKMIVKLFCPRSSLGVQQQKGELVKPQQLPQLQRPDHEKRTPFQVSVHTYNKFMTQCFSSDVLSLQEAKEKHIQRKGRVFEAPYLGLRDQQFRRLAGRASVKHISAACFPLLRAIVRHIIRTIMQKAIIDMLHSKRRTINQNDLATSLATLGITYYGFL